MGDRLAILRQPAARGGMVTGIRALIVDDEAAVRRGVRLLLEDDPEVQVVGEAASADEAVDAVLRQEPDLMFLDIQLGEGDGFAVLEELEEDRMPLVVFATAYDHYALQAFELHAVDYLLKPFSDERFGTALERAKSRIREWELEEIRGQMSRLLNEVEQSRQETGIEEAPAGIGEDQEAAPPLRRIMVRSASRIHFVDVDRIDWIEAAGDYVRLHVGDRSHLHRETMYRLAKRLDPSEFVRIHRSAIVRLDRIDAVRFDERGGHHVILVDGTEHSLSRSGRRRLEEALGEDL